MIPTVSCYPNASAWPVDRLMRTVLYGSYMTPYVTYARDRLFELTQCLVLAEHDGHMPIGICAADAVLMKNECLKIKKLKIKLEIF